jgi:hypothetical protein
MRNNTGTGMIASAITAAALTMILDVGPASAQAAPRERFGERGQNIVTSDLALDFRYETISIAGGDDVTRSTYDLHAAFDRVVFAPLTFGVRIGWVGFKEGAFDSRRRFDMGARLGAIVHLGGEVSLWPTLGLEYGVTTAGDRETSNTVHSTTLQIAVPVFWEAAPHVLLGAGPTYSRDLSAGEGPDPAQQLGKTTAFGLHGLIGLWF